MCSVCPLNLVDREEYAGTGRAVRNTVSEKVRGIVQSHLGNIF